MTRFLELGFCGVLLGALTASGVSAQAFDDSAGSGPILIFHVLNLAQVPADVLLEANQHVRRIYASAGVPILWWEGDGTGLSGPGRDGLGLTIVLVTETVAREMGDYDEMVTGFATSNDGHGPRRAYVFAQRAQKEAIKLRRNTRDPGQKTVEGLVLGHVIAHEAGHLMLPHGHSTAGIMRGRLDESGLRAALSGKLLFTLNQSELMRATLLSQLDIRVK